MKRKISQLEAHLIIELMARRSKPSYQELARKILYVEPLPQGALAIYERTPARKPRKRGRKAP